jgi:hypothetical protein
MDESKSVFMHHEKLMGTPGFGCTCDRMLKTPREMSFISFGRAA